MKKTFEDRFTKLQSDMIAVSLEYVEGKADKIYIYASTMDGIYLVDCFF